MRCFFSFHARRGQLSASLGACSGRRRLAPARLLWLLLSSLLSLPLAASEAVTAEPPLLVVVDELATSYPDYAVVRAGQPMSGQLVNFWRCVLQGAQRPAQFSVRPGARGRHELAAGQLDLLIPKIKPSTHETVELGQAVYTQPYDYVHYMLVSLKSRVQLLEEVNWVERNLGVARTSVLHTYVEQLGGRIETRVKSVKQLFKLLLGERVDLVLLISPWPASDIRQFGGMPLAARSLLQSSVHGLLSQQRVAREPQLLWRINRQISACQLTSPITIPNPFL